MLCPPANDDSGDEWFVDAARLRHIEARARDIAATLRHSPATPCSPDTCLHEAQKLVVGHPDSAALVWMLSEVFAALVGLPPMPPHP